MIQSTTPDAADQPRKASRYNPTFGQLLCVPLLVASAIIACVTIYGYAALLSIKSNAAQRNKHSDCVRSLYDYAATMSNAEVGQRGFVLTRDPAYLADYYYAITTEPSAFIALQQSCDLPRSDSLHAEATKRFVVMNNGLLTNHPSLLKHSSFTTRIDAYILAEKQAIDRSTSTLSTYCNSLFTSLYVIFGTILLTAIYTGYILIPHVGSRGRLFTKILEAYNAEHDLAKSLLELQRNTLAASKPVSPVTIIK